MNILLAFALNKSYYIVFIFSPVASVCFVWKNYGDLQVYGNTWVMAVHHNCPCTVQHTMLGDRWLPNMLHISHPHMLYSWELPYRRERCTSQQECPSLSADLPGWRSRSITSYSINLGEALCQLKVEGAISWARAELAGHWPSMRYGDGVTWRTIYYFQLSQHMSCFKHRVLQNI